MHKDLEVSKGIAENMYDWLIIGGLDELRQPFEYGDNSFALDVKRNDGKEVRIVISTFTPQNV